MKSTYDIQADYTELDGTEFRRSVKKTRLLLDKKTKRPVRLYSAKQGTWEITSPGKFYLAGPMRGYPLFNFPAFLIAARILKSRGIEVMSPAEKDIEAGFDPSRGIEEQNFDIGAAFSWDVRAITETKGIILMPGWEKSLGAKTERLVAKMCQREVYLLTANFDLIEAPDLDLTLEWQAAASPVVKVRTPAIVQGDL